MNKINVTFFVLLLVGISISQTVLKHVIDDFNVSQPPENRNQGSTFPVVQTDSTVFGGARTITSYVSSPTSGTSSLNIGSGEFVYVATGTAQQVSWGYTNSNDPLDVTDSLGFEMDITATTMTLGISITTGINQKSALSTTKNFSGISYNGLLQILFADFPNSPGGKDKVPTPPDWTKVLSISITMMTSSPTTSITIRSIGFYGSLPSPVNAQFTGAIGVVPTEIVSFDNTYGSEEQLTQCSEISQASNFLWYKVIPANVHRMISVSTCDTPYDTVLGVFSGNDFSSLSVSACNDDATDLGPDCNPTSSFVTDINVAAGETVYVVVGGYIDSTSQSADAGPGTLYFTLLQSESVPLDLEILVQQREIIVDAIEASSTDVQDALDALETSLTSTIESGDDEIIQEIADSQTALENLIADVQDKVDIIDTTLVATHEEVTAISQALDNVSDVVDDIASTTSQTQTNLGTLSGYVAEMNSDIADSFAAVAGSIGTLQSTSNDIQSAVSNVQNAISSQQNSINAISSQISSFETTTANSFTAVGNQVTGVSQAVSDVSTQLSDAKEDIQTSVAAVKSDTSASLSILTPLQSNIKADTNQVLFTQTYINYLSDSNAIAPLNIRMPNAFGGKMEETAAAVVALYNGLKANALAIGTLGSTACTNNAFCNYFLVTAEPAYIDAMSKYNSNLTARKFKLAYTNLQKAYTSLYPTSW